MLAAALSFQGDAKVFAPGSWGLLGRVSWSGAGSAQPKVLTELSEVTRLRCRKPMQKATVLYAVQVACRKRQAMCQAQLPSFSGGPSRVHPCPGIRVQPYSSKI